jgi:hypothetical protein
MAELARSKAATRFEERMRLLMQLEATESRVVAAVLERDTIRAELIAHIKDSAAATGACTSAVAAATAAVMYLSTDMAATEAATEPAAATEVLGVETDSPMTPPPMTPP